MAQILIIRGDEDGMRSKPGSNRRNSDLADRSGSSRGLPKRISQVPARQAKKPLAVPPAFMIGVLDWRGRALHLSCPPRGAGVTYSEINDNIGGFGVSSDLTWQAQGGVEWNITRWLYLRASYRHLVTEFDEDEFEFDVEQSGPQLELGLRF